MNNINDGEQEGGEGNGGGTKNTGATANSAGSGDEGGAPAAVGGSSGTVGGAGVQEEGGATSEGGATTVAGGATSEGGAAQGGAGSCDDSVGEPSCANVSQDCLSYCNAAVANLKPAVAVAAIACLEADATCNDGYGCLADATAQACPEDVEAACTAAITTCGEPDVGDPACAQLLSGFNADARAAAISCTEESCLSVYVCAEGLFFE